jgi:hypothetical protein
MYIHTLATPGTLLLRRLAGAACDIALANNNFIDGIIDAVEIQAAYENARVGNANDLVRQKWCLHSGSE